MPGVQNVNIDMPQQKVTVTVDDSVTPDAVKETVAKTGKETSFFSE
jgi:copper chaperone CopZ